jgi:hypothetical protein
VKTFAPIAVSNSRWMSNVRMIILGMLLRPTWFLRTLVSSPSRLKERMILTLTMMGTMKVRTLFLFFPVLRCFEIKNKYAICHPSSIHDVKHRKTDILC